MWTQALICTLAGFVGWSTVSLYKNRGKPSDDAPVEVLLDYAVGEHKKKVGEVMSGGKVFNGSRREGQTLIHDYTLARTIKVDRAKLTSGLRTSVCSQRNVTLLEKGVSYAFVYRAPSGRELAHITVGLADCGLKG